MIRPRSGILGHNWTRIENISGEHLPKWIRVPRCRRFPGSIKPLLTTTFTRSRRHRIPIMSQHRRGSIHGSPVPGHPSTTVSASISSSASHEVQTRGIPLPGMVPPRSIHASPMHGNPIHGFVNPLGPGGLVHSPPPTHTAAASGISHHPSNVHQGIGTAAVNDGYIIF